MDDFTKRTWAEIDLDAIRHNYHAIRSVLPEGCRFLGVVKADAYGHGAVETAKAISDMTDFFAVATMEEAMELRNAGLKDPILILGYVHPSYYRYAVENDIRLTVFDPEDAYEISGQACSIGSRAKIHIKVDTGMGRIGFIPEDKSIQQMDSEMTRDSPVDALSSFVS